MQKRTRKAAARWTAAQVERFAQIARARKPARVAAARLGRTEQAVRQKAMAEGISFRSIARPRRATRRTRRRRR